MWFAISLLAGFLFALNKLIVRESLSKNVNPLAFGALHELLAGALLLPIAIFYVSWPQSTEIWLAFIFGVVFIFLTDLTAFFALKHTEASLYQIVGQLRHVVVLIGALYLFAEPILVFKIISIIFIILGVTIALFEKSKVEITKGTVYSFISTVCIAVAFLAIKKALIDVNPAFLASVGFIVSGFVMSAFFLTNKQNFKTLNTNTLKLIILAALVFAIFELSSFTALKIGEASRVTPVMQSSVIFTLIGGYLFLNERKRIAKKIIGCFFVALGILLLYFT